MRSAEIDSAQIKVFSVLTVAKLIGGMALRLVYPFNTDIASGLGVSLSSVGAALGAGELTGMASGAVGRDLDRGFYRRWALISVACLAVGCVALGVGANIVIFGGAFAAIAFSVATLTTTAHTWIGANVPLARRGRIMGIYETSWALALLFGAPIAGILISAYAWWTPFVGIGVAAVAVGVVLLRVMPARDHHEGASAHAAPRLRQAVREFSPSAWMTLAASIAMTVGSIAVFATYGAWLKEEHGFTTGSVAALTLGLGAVEFVGSLGVAAIADRIGPAKAVIAGAFVMGAAAAAMFVAGSGVRPIAVIATILFFFGFEFGFVANLTLVSDAGGSAKGAFVGVNHSLSTVCRAGAAAGATAVYDQVSMRPVCALAIAAAIIAAIAAFGAARVAAPVGAAATADD